MFSFNQEQLDKLIAQSTGGTSDEANDLKFQPISIAGGKSPSFPIPEPVVKVTITLDPERLGKAK